MFDYVKPQGFKFTIRHLGMIISFLLMCMDVYSIYAFFNGIKMYPFNFMFWNNFIVGIVWCLTFPFLVYLVFFITAYVVTTMCKPEIKLLFDGEPESVRYYVCEKHGDSHYEIMLENGEYLRIASPEITYIPYQDVVTDIYKICVDKKLNWFEKFCLGPIDNQINARLLLPLDYDEHPEKYLMEDDGSPKELYDVNVKYKKVYDIKKGKNTYEFMDKVDEILEKEKAKKKEKEKKENDKQC